jgi:hypothetical protein
MSNDRVGRWLTIGANLAVLMGLVFVGMELRESRTASAIQAADAIADGFLQLNIISVTDSTAARVWVVGLQEPERLSDVEAIQFSMHLRALFNQFQRVHRLYRTQLIPEADWALFATEAAWLMSTPGGRSHFAGNALGEDFKSDVERYAGADRNLDLRLGRDSWPIN